MKPQLTQCRTLSHCLWLSLFVILVAVVSCGFSSNDEDNHSPIKRQGDDFFFGGWRPIVPGNPFYFGSSGLHQDLAAALAPDNLDVSSSYYTPSQLEKDIFSYYPRPAFRSAPKHNTPVYVESTSKRRQRPQKHRGPPREREAYNHKSNGFHLQQLQGLQDVYVTPQHLPLSHLTLPHQHGKKVELVEVSLLPLHQNGRGNGKGSIGDVGYGHLPRGHSSPQAVNVEYVQVPLHEVKQSSQQILPKHAPVVPVRIPHRVQSIEDVIDVKNIQVVEVAVPAAQQHGHHGRDNGLRQYETRNRRRFPPGHLVVPKHPPQLSIPSSDAYHVSKEEHQQQHLTHEYPSHGGRQEFGHGQQQPQIAAELIKVSDEQIKSLLKSIHIVDKNSKEAFRYLPVSGAPKKKKQEEVHIVLAVPEGNGHHKGSSASEHSLSGYQTDGQHVAVPVSDQHHGRYQDIGIQLIEHQPDGYHSEEHHGGAQVVEYHPSGYQNEAHHGEAQTNQHAQSGYQTESHHGGAQAVDHQHSGYQMETHHGGAQAVDHQHGGYQTEAHHGGAQVAEHSQGAYQVEGHQSDADSHRGRSPSPEHHIAYQIEYQQTGATRGSDHSHSGDGSYRREPVLAVELKHGQSIEDAIKSLDINTLQQLRAHSGKDGLEVEVVQVQNGEYASESQKQETAVAVSKNSTTTKT